ncbi:MAG: ribbon-helix-helix protein, CopG family [Kiloniellales bacterium]|nr:ribbon-helix-helix protein, CopG family [Kiloniellales bacterium]
MKRLERIAAERGTSASEILRQAIESFDSQDAETLDSLDLMALVAERLQEAIASTRRANFAVSKTLQALSKRGV